MPRLADYSRGSERNTVCVKSEVDMVLPMRPRESGGRLIHPLPPEEEARAVVYAKIRIWGHAHGLPSDAEYRARLTLPARAAARQGGRSG
jgi:hypothetical protein